MEARKEKKLDRGERERKRRKGRDDGFAVPNSGIISWLCWFMEGKREEGKKETS